MLLSLLILFLASGEIFAAPKEHNDKLMHPRLPPSNNRHLKVNPDEGKSSYWVENAQNTVLEKTGKPLNQNTAKNVILFLGDGMSIPTVSAARVYTGGEEIQLSFDKFPYTGLSKTYAVNRQVADSANTATAYLCGVKANYGTIGVGPEVSIGDCVGMTNATNHALSIAYYSQLAKKRTGLVTTARVTHASPAGVYAHTSLRDWESDSDILNDDEDPTVCADIATQLVSGETGKNLNVVMGGGRAKFIPKETEDEEGHKGDRSDGENLIRTWLAQTQNAQYVWNRDDLLALDDTVDNLLGLFGTDHLSYNLDRDPTNEPSLAEMTQAAIEVLSRGDNGFFLFVEGAKIDMAHHGGQAHKAMDETAEFAKAIQVAADLTDEADTLIVVTADHAHTMSYSGYADRGNDILEFGGEASDGKVYTTLNYANGPGYRQPESDGSRHDISQDNYEDKDYVFPAVAPLGSETHGGDDVGIFARGPWAHLFSGVLEENVIPHLMSYASCVGEGYTACADAPLIK
jgi:alkaline phosphatase